MQKKQHVGYVQFFERSCQRLLSTYFTYISLFGDTP